MSLGDIFDKIKEIFTGEPDQKEQHVRPASEDPQGDPADQQNENAGYSRRSAHEDRNSGILPSSQDPRGDPADQQSNILPSSQDPQGDPADQQSNILPASQDPRGDPADER